MSLEFESGIPLVVATFVTDKSVNTDILLAMGLDVAELRIDLCKNQSIDAIKETLSAFKNAGIYTMVTIRSWPHGGYWTGSHEDRIALLMAVIDDVDIVDIEVECDVPTELRARLKGKESPDGPLLLVSYHNTKQTPSHSELSSIRDKALEKNPDLTKYACQVYSDKDVARLAAFLLAYAPESQMIVIGMGPQGKMTRIAFSQLGSLMTFCCHQDGLTAPGQLSLDETVNILRVFNPKYNEKIVRRLEEINYF